VAEPGDFKPACPAGTWHYMHEVHTWNAKWRVMFVNVHVSSLQLLDEFQVNSMLGVSSKSCLSNYGSLKVAVQGPDFWPNPYTYMPVKFNFYLCLSVLTLTLRGTKVELHLFFQTGWFIIKNDHDTKHRSYKDFQLFFSKHLLYDEYLKRKTRKIIRDIQCKYL
jgi:hypothetical protein